MKILFAVGAALLAICMVGCNDHSPKPSGERPLGAVDKKESGADTDFLGLPLRKAESLADKRGLKHRVTKVDGEHRPATMDYRLDRVSFEVKSGKVVGVSRG